MDVQRLKIKDFWKLVFFLNPLKNSLQTLTVLATVFPAVMLKTLPQYLFTPSVTVEELKEALAIPLGI